MGTCVCAIIIHSHSHAHTGDFTRFGKEEDAIDFNQWLGTLPHTHKLVVNGNHEANAGWNKGLTKGVCACVCECVCVYWCSYL
jgi:hypothetical protein